MKKTISGLVLTALLVIFAWSTSASANNANHSSTYEGGPHNAVCYKHEGNSDHAKITNGGKSVVLKPYGASWPGDYWETLVVKGGNDRTIIPHPTVGTEYSAPLNNGGNVPKVSHYIVCKGTTPESTPDPEPSVTPTPEPTVTPSTEPEVPSEPACGPIGSCGEVPTYVTPTPEPKPTVVNEKAKPAQPVVAEATFTG